jgi:hypothetical protein
VVIVVRRNDVRGRAVKGYDSNEWSSDDVMLRLGRSQNEDVVG